ncbi:NRAMP family divalent metal transporter [Endozoicomonas lisbonensis]|uniref:Mn2+/Fe2+ NRAMP family transporter n=1 Tax=Endozoicomonas lisbonensis TaxID=3120522 RepID=A0ABV2SIP3_9GAMM
MSTPAMSSSSSPAASPRLSFSALGPGIMVAAAAIGGSHLVASTQAGAVYGWQLVGLIILVNFFKYPFFQFGARYSAATGESLLAGYARLGKPWLVLFLVLNVFAGVVNIAALLGLTGALATFIVPGVTPPVLAGVAAVISLMIVLRGHYRMVDVVSKWIVLLLAVVTVLATLLAFSQPAAAAPGFVAPTPWTLASLGVLISLMGWMPAPVEVSAMNSVWSRNKFMNRGRPDMRVALFDLNVGFIGTALLALFFVALGARILHGSGVELATSGAAFSRQLADMYGAVIGDWSRWLVITAALCCIYSSTLTCIDGYNRVNKSAIDNLRGEDNPDTESPLLVLLVTSGALGLVLMFPGTMLAMLKFAMIAAFLTTPVFALMNYRLIRASHIPDEHRIGKVLNIWSQAGLAFLFGFSFLFIWWQWLM